MAYKNFRFWKKGRKRNNYYYLIPKTPNYVRRIKPYKNPLGRIPRNKGFHYLHKRWRLARLRNSVVVTVGSVLEESSSNKCAVFFSYTFPCPPSPNNATGHNERAIDYKADDNDVITISSDSDVI